MYVCVCVCVCVDIEDYTLPMLTVGYQYFAVVAWRNSQRGTSYQSTQSKTNLVATCSYTTTIIKIMYTLHMQPIQCIYTYSEHNIILLYIVEQCF